MTLGMLETKNLAIGYRRPRQGTAVVAADIKVALRGGELVCLLGPNGAGKSTLIRTLAGLQAPLAGTVCLDGTTVHDLPSRELAKRMSLVLTQRVAVGMMPVSSFVALGRHPYTDWTGKLRRRDEEVVRRVIAEVGIESLAHRPLCELSDGERRRSRSPGRWPRNRGS
jgi:iron complex transport system ATP-binding protein